MFPFTFKPIDPPSHQFYQLIQRAPNLFALYLFHHFSLKNETQTSLRYCHSKIVLEKRGKTLEAVTESSGRFDLSHCLSKEESNVIKLGKTFLQVC